MHLLENSLGEGNHKNAYSLVKWTLAVGLMASALQISIIVFLHYFIFTFYTSSEEVIDILNTFVIIICVQTLLDHIQGTLRGVFKASGKQKQASIYLAISFWVFGGISFYILAFYFELRIHGLWIGFAFATFIWSIWYWSAILTFDWKKEWDLALKRIEDEFR